MTRKEGKAELIYKDESYAIIGACFEVYRDKGCGFLEPVYHECLEIELEFSTNSIFVETTADVAISRPHIGSNIHSGFRLLRKNHSRNQGGLSVVR